MSDRDLTRFRSFGDRSLGGRTFGDRSLGGRTFGDRPVRRVPRVPYVDLPEDDRDRRNALEWLTDVLSTGQYLGANLIEDALAGEWRDPIGGAITGKRRGDWENLLFGGPSSVEGAPDLPGIGGGIDPQTAGTAGKVARGAGGFLANVLLDPTSYVSFGATAAARAGAKQFARMAVNQARRQLADPEVTARVFGGRAARTGLTAEQRMQAIGDAPLNQYLARVYRDAEAEALTTPSAVLRKRYLGRLADERQAAVDTRRSLLGNTAKWAKESKRHAKQRMQAVDAELAKAGDDQVWRFGLRGDADYGGFHALGEGAWRFGGRELLRTGAPGPVRRQIAEVGAAVRRAAREFPVTKLFLDAWWASKTHGAVGAITRRLGFFRSGYQTMLRQTELGLQSRAQDVVHENMRKVDEVFEGTSEETRRAFSTLLSRVYDYAGRAIKGIDDPARKRAALNAATAQALDDPAVRAAVPAGEWDAAIDVWSQVKTLTDEWHREEAQWAAAGIIRETGYIANYLPIRFRPDPGGAAGDVRARGGELFAPLFHRQASFSQARRQEIDAEMAFFGIPEELATAIVDDNSGRLVTDVAERLRARGIANARMRGRATLLEQMRSMGLNIEEVRASSRAASALHEGGAGAGAAGLRQALAQGYESGSLGRIGLHRVAPAEKYFDGWVFDREVANVIDRTIEATGDDLHVLGRAFRAYTRWIQGWLTLTPRFHIRNALSNQMMVFMREGSRAFNPRYLTAGMAGAAAELRRMGDSKLVAAAEAVTRKTGMKLALQERIGEYSVEELAEYARQRGVISRISHTGDPVEAASKQRGAANPLRWQSGVMEASKNAGALIESSQRFGMFLMEVDRLKRPGLRLTEGELEFAAFEARKWLVDYQDLTDFEQKHLKTLIPFYAWLRHAAANMVEGVLANPQLYGAVLKGREALEGALSGGEELDEALAPEWMREAGMISVGPGEDGKRVMLNLGIPLSELNLFALSFPERGEIGLPRLDGQSLIAELAKRAHPTLQSAYELASGRDLYSERGIEGFQRAPRGLRPLQAAPGALRLLDSVARVGWSRRGLGFTDAQGRPREDREGRLLMDGRTAAVLGNHLPLLDWIGRALDGPVWMLERTGLAVEEALERADLSRDDHDNLDEVLRLMSFYLGLPAYQVDPVRERRRRIMEARERRRQERNRYAGRTRVRERGLAAAR